MPKKIEPFDYLRNKRDTGIVMMIRCEGINSLAEEQLATILHAAKYYIEAGRAFGAEVTFHQNLGTHLYDQLDVLAHNLAEVQSRELDAKDEEYMAMAAKRRKKAS